MTTQIDNFLKMEPDTPEYSERNGNLYFKDNDPVYYLADIRNQNIIDTEKNNAPLAGNNALQTILYGTGYTLTYPFNNTDSIEKIIEDNNNSDGTLFYVVSYLGVIWKFRIGTPLANSQNYFDVIGTTINVSTFYIFQDVIKVGGYIFTFANFLSNSPSTYIVFNAATLIPYGSAQIDNLSYRVGKQELEFFLDHIYITDDYQTQSNRGRIISYQVSNGSLSRDSLIGLTLPNGYSVAKMLNYNNRYLLVVANNVDILKYEIGNQNGMYMFIWNGIAKNYQNAIKLPGAFIDMIMIGDECKILIQDKTNRYSIYTYNGGNSIVYNYTLGYITPYNKTQNVVFPQISNLFRNTRPLRNINNKLGIVLSDNSVMIIGDSPIGQQKNVYYGQGNNVITLSGNNRTGDVILMRYPSISPGGIDFLCRSRWVDSDVPLIAVGSYQNWLNSNVYTVGSYVLYNYMLYRCLIQNTGISPNTNPTYWKLTPVSIYSNISYKSKWIPVKGIRNIVIEYEPFQTANDSFDVSILGYEEQYNNTSSSSTRYYTINQANQTNTKSCVIPLNSFLGQSTYIQITIQSNIDTANGSYWRPIIRKILINDES